MDLINEKHAWYYLSSSLFSPFSDLLIDLLSHLLLYFTDVSCEESEEPLGPAVDNIDFMKSDSMHNFLPLLKLAFGALHKPGLRADIVVVTASRERSAEL